MNIQETQDTKILEHNIQHLIEKKNNKNQRGIDLNINLRPICPSYGQGRNLMLPEYRKMDYKYYSVTK
jgi:hypothetical protein